MAELGVQTLVMALEESPNTRLGVNLELHAPAAAQWLSIAGDEIKRLCTTSSKRFPAGDLWAATGGSDLVNAARLEFWRRRLSETGYEEGISMKNEKSA